MRVFLAEKPSQGKDIASVLGCNKKADGYLYNDNTIVTWGYGHLLSLAEPSVYNEKFGKFDLDNLPIIPTEFKLVSNPKSKSQLKVVKDCIKKATEVVIATDADREGELIARLILDDVKYNGSIKRLWLSALDEESIKKALNNIKDGSETINLYYAALGRQRADWLLGYNYTPAATLVYGSYSSGLYSVGRVQTPTLAMIVERDIEIENFKSKDFFGLLGDFQKLKADWIVPESSQGDEDGRCLDEKIIKEVINKCKGKDTQVIECSENAKRESAPLCLSLSELQKIANNKYGYDAKKVLEIAQSLYEKHKATTYPRSDCGYLPTTQKGDIKNIFNHLADDNYKAISELADTTFESRVWNDKKVGESSHHALIPTTKKADLSLMSDQEKNVYDIIARHYIAQFLGDYQYNETIIELDCEKEKFKTKGIVPTELGWKKAFDKEETQNDAMEVLPKLTKGEVLNCVSLTVQKKKTKPPSHYNDATLISAMKNCGRKIEDASSKEILAEVKGIGTEATRADVIETLKGRSYITKKGKSLISTDKGRALIKNLPNDLTSVIITADWESKLSEVAKGNFSLDDFLAGTLSVLKDNLSKIIGQVGSIQKVVNNPCHECGAELIRRPDKKKGKGFYWMCSNMKRDPSPCKTFLDDKNGKPVKKEKAIVAKEKCEECNSDVSLRDGPYGKYWSCTNYPTCKKNYPDTNGSPLMTGKLEKFNCPDCSKPLRQLNSKKGKFWGCSGFKEGCKSSFDDKDNKPLFK